MMIVVNTRHRKQEAELEEARFEQNLFINNPAMYQEYLKNKEDNAENEGAVWLTPQSSKEIEELDKIFSEINEQLSDNSDEKEANDEFIKQVGLMELFGNINVDEIGDE